MRVFISWSGDTSQKVAEQLRDWIPSVLQSVKAYFTPSDVEKGARWSTEIFTELEASAYGIVVLTKDNLERPWVLFESGALIAKLGAKVCPLLIGVTPADVQGPLSHFQGTQFQRNDFKKLMGDINRDLGPSGVTAEVFDRIFDKWWPDLETAIEKVLAQSPPTKAKTRSDRDILEEVLLNVRTLQRDRNDKMAPVAPGASRKLITAFANIATKLSFNADREECVDAMLQMTTEFRQIARSSFTPPAWQQISEELDRAQQELQNAKDEIPF